MLLVPPHLYETACRILFSKKIKELGNYALFKYKKKTSWSRWRQLSGNTNIFPKDADHFGIKIKTTKAMRKREHPKFYYYEDWNAMFPKFQVGHPY